jgi:hypothetical protein
MFAELLPYHDIKLHDLFLGQLLTNHEEMVVLLRDQKE